MRALILVLLTAACGHHHERPRASRPIALPADHALHPEFKTEWWYWNGHFSDDDGNPYDFFLSFTRHDTREDRFLGIPIVSLKDSHIGMFAFVDQRAARVETSAKVNFPDMWAADGDTDRAWVFHDSWGAQLVNDAHFVTARTANTELHLELDPFKPAARYGQGGFVDQGGNPHYVYSYTRLELTGALLQNGQSKRVRGIGWFDHFIGHVARKDVQEWDWMSLQLDDGFEFMLAQLHLREGTLEPYANFEVDDRGAVRTLGQPPVWTVTRRWKSPASDNVFRIAWHLEGPELSLDIEPVLDDQEFRSPPISKFWEGATVIHGVHRGQPVKGRGYLETVAEGGLPVGAIEFGR